MVLSSMAAQRIYDSMFCRYLFFSILILLLGRATIVDAQTEGLEWDPSEAKKLDGHLAVILDVAISPDGRTAATASNDRNVVLWDTESGKEKVRIKTFSTGVTALDFSADGSQLVTGCRDKDAVLWNVGTGTEISRFPNHTGSISALALSPDGRFLVVGIDSGQAGVWDARIAKPLHAANIHSKTITAVAFASKSPRPRFALASRDKTVSLWNAETGKQQLVFKEHRNSVESLAFSSEGSRIVSGSADKTALIWNSYGGQVIRRLEGHDDAVTFTAFAPDDKTVYTASKDGTFIQWDVRTGEPLIRCKVGKPIAHAAVSSDAFKTIAVGIENSATVFSTESLGFDEPESSTSAEIRPFAELPQARPIDRFDPNSQADAKSGFRGNQVRFHPNGPFALSAGGDQNGLVWDISRRNVVFTFSHRDALTSAAFAPTGRHFAVGSKDGCVSVFESQTGKVRYTLRGHTGAVDGLAFSKDGKAMLSVGEDRLIVAWNLDTGRSTGTFTGHAGSVKGIAILSEISAAVSISSDRTVRLWTASAKDNRILNENEPEEGKSPLTALALSPDERFFAVGAENKTITIWDAKELKTLNSLTGLLVPPVAMEFSPDGKSFLAGGSDGVLVQWNTETWKPVRTFPQIPRSVEEKLAAEAEEKTMRKKWTRRTSSPIRYEPICSMSFNKDGSQILTGGGRETFLWDFLQPISREPKKSETPGGRTPGNAGTPRAPTFDFSALPEGKEIRRIENFQQAVLTAALSRDGSRVAVSEKSKRITVFDAASGEEVSRWTARSPYKAVEFLPDGRNLLGAAEDGRLFSINSISKKDNFVEKVHTDQILSVALSPGGAKAISGGADHNAVLWKLPKGESLGRLTGHRKPINDVALNRDGSKALTASDDRSVILWDAVTCKQIVKIDNLQGGARSVAFSPDGNIFAVGLHTGMIVLYRTLTGKEIAQYRCPREAVVALRFCPDGNRILCALDGGSAIVWDIPSAEPIRRFSGPYNVIVGMSMTADGQTFLLVDPRGVSIYKTE